MTKHHLPKQPKNVTHRYNTKLMGFFTSDNVVFVNVAVFRNLTLTLNEDQLYLVNGESDKKNSHE